MRIYKIYSFSQSKKNIYPVDIYDFYYITYLIQSGSLNSESAYNKFIIEEKISEIKDKYISSFENLILNQLNKYLSRGRVDEDFPSKLQNGISLSEMMNLMKKTFRSDMIRRNERWEMITEYTLKLTNANEKNEIIKIIDRLNNLLHNAETQVIEKLPNGNALINALDFSHKSTVNQLRNKVSKDVKELE